MGPSPRSGEKKSILEGDNYPPWNSYFWTKMDGYWLKDEISVFFFPFSALSFPGNFEKFTPVTLSKETPAAVRRTRQLQRQSTVPWRYEGGTWVTRLSGGFFGVFFVFFPDSFARQRCLIITNLTCTYSKLTSHYWNDNFGNDNCSSAAPTLE